jgi:hypothetical protein
VYVASGIAIIPFSSAPYMRESDVLNPTMQIAFLTTEQFI